MSAALPVLTGMPAVQAKDQHCFAACLFTCQALVDFHTAVELSWLNQQDLPGVVSLCMPFFVSAIREYTGKVCPPATPTAPLPPGVRSLIGAATRRSSRGRTD